MQLPEIPDELFRALADRHRRMILAQLAESPTAVHRIAERFDISRPAISKHLRVLGEAQLVVVRRAGKENVYALNADALNDVRRWLDALWSERLALLKRLSEGDA